jgi:hypothetical protein
MHKLLNVTILAALLVGVTACEAPTDEETRANNERHSRLVAVIDGCRIFRVYDSDTSEHPYFARCPEGAADTVEQHTTGGKNPKTKTTVTLGDQ